MRPLISVDLILRRSRARPAACLAALALAMLCGCARFGNASLQFTPDSFSDCKGPNIKVNIAWDATSRTKGPVNIYIYKLGNPPILWHQGPAKGSMETGEWMSDGSTVRLTTARGKLLAMRTLVTTPCQ